jgi:PTS system ascorbate-specific IIA component
MVGILIIAHGTLGESLVHCAIHVLGSRPSQFQHLSVSLHDDPKAILAQARELIRQLDKGDGVLILSDMLGGTPCNVTSRLLVPRRIEGIAGVNLPMLVRALTYRNEPLITVVEKALSGGYEGVVHLSQKPRHAAAGS